MSSKEGAATCTQWPYDSGQDTPLRLQCAHSTTADAVDPRCLRSTRLGVNQQRRQQRHGTNTLGYPRDLLLADGKPAATKSYTWPRQKNNNLKDPISTAPDDQLAATSLGYQSYPASSSNGIFLSSVNTHRYDHFTGTDGAHNTVFSGKRKTSGRLMPPPSHEKNNLLQHTGGGLGSTLVDNIVTQHIQRTPVSFPFLN